MCWTELGALVMPLLLCAISGPLVIPLLHKLHFGQSIRECGPREHLKKSGTPTMGGVLIILSIVFSIFVLCPLRPQILIALWLLVGYGAIGFIDDFIKVVLKRNLGLTSLQKIVMQLVLAAVYLLYPGSGGAVNSVIWVPGLNLQVDLGFWYYLFVLLLLVGTTNAVNLTDGLDGLVSMVTVPVALAYAYIAFASGQTDLALFALTLCGSCLGFLLFNYHPAKIFMGDTGSLALGGGVAALALLTKTEVLLVVIGGIYVIETLSVIIQVLCFKLTHGKRVFRMSPLHHHYELGGWRETKVVWVFSVVSFLSALAGVGLFVLKA